MQKIIWQSLLMIYIIGCSHQKKDFKFYPLSPSTTTRTVIIPTNGSQDIQDTIKTKTYIIEGDISTDTENIKKIILNFINTSETDFVAKNRHCQINFFKTSSALHKNFQETHNDGLGAYINNELAEVTWVKGMLLMISFYKDSKFIGTTY